MQNASNLLKELVVHEAAELSSKQEASKSQYLVHHRYICTQLRLKRPTKIFWKQFTTSVWYMNLSVAMTIPFSKSSAVSLTAMVSLILHMAKVYANITLLYIAKLISNTLYHSILHYIILILLSNWITFNITYIIFPFRICRREGDNEYMLSLMKILTCPVSNIRLLSHYIFTGYTMTGTGLWRSTILKLNGAQYLSAKFACTSAMSKTYYWSLMPAENIC